MCWKLAICWKIRNNMVFSLKILQKWPQKGTKIHSFPNFQHSNRTQIHFHYENRLWFDKMNMRFLCYQVLKNWIIQVLKSSGRMTVKSKHNILKRICCKTMKEFLEILLGCSKSEVKMAYCVLIVIFDPSDVKNTIIVRNFQEEPAATET